MTPNPTTNFWNQQFSSADFRYGTEPNAFLQTQSRLISPSANILVPGDGEGRNSVWLAQQGHRVLAMDASDVGLRKAEELANRCGVQVRTVLADLASWQPDDVFDALVLTYVHLPPSLRTVAHRRLAETLRPGGLLVLEAFHPDQLGRSSGGPQQADMLYSLETLRGDFAGLIHEEFAEECETMLNEGIGHQGQAYVTRMVGRRI